MLIVSPFSSSWNLEAQYTSFSWRGHLLSSPGVLWLMGLASLPGYSPTAMADRGGGFRGLCWSINQWDFLATSRPSEVFDPAGSQRCMLGVTRVFVLHCIAFHLGQLSQPCWTCVGHFLFQVGFLNCTVHSQATFLCRIGEKLSISLSHN